jgi:hypothetical protein
MKIIVMKSMASQALTKFSLGSSFVFRSLHFIANQLGELSMQELKPQEILGPDVDKISPTRVRDDRVLMACPRHKSKTVGECESGFSRDNVDHFRSLILEELDSIYIFMLSLESDSKNNHKVFMLGQGDAPIDQTEQEIVKVLVAEIVRQKKLAKDAERAAGKYHLTSQDQNNKLTDPDVDGTTSRGAPPQV